MKVKDIADIIERFAPLATAEGYDNTGLMLGDFLADVKGVLISLDLTTGAVKKATAEGCNLIITHHPAIFKPLKNLNLNGAYAHLFRDAFIEGINIYSAHTNVDAAKDGISFETAGRIGLKNVRAFTETPCMGVYGEYDGTLEGLAAEVSDRLGDPTVTYAGEPDMRVKTVVLCGGAGGNDREFVGEALSRADVLISAEFKHSFFVDAAELKKGAVQFSHYAGEICFLDIIYKLLKPLCGKLELFKYNPGAPCRVPRRTK
ncbi:MAG: Nif3-like dinuclear metal center hexameric protein [Clostridiaceae bacterium]|jgi:dinuclear metal center YbgI/SA1388 family protein|nr:Nif3-like dinuclear metal center hexameric protein [Clostridiaceae bacterium]